MPFDLRVAMALGALRRSTAEFRSSVQGALAQATSDLAAASAGPAARAEQAGRELGVFGASRMSAERFAELFSVAVPLDRPARGALERAVAILNAVVALEESAFVAEVKPGRGLGATIDDALAIAGSAFGAIIVAELVRSGRYRPVDHDRLFDAVEFRQWNRTERRFAPPLIVEVNGVDLNAGALLNFADGREKLVLVVHGDAPPAALVRCVTPGTLVLQTVDGKGLDRLAAYEGPAIAALVPQGAAEFMHDPAAGPESWQRVTVSHLPAPPTRAIGGASAWQMGEDLKMLANLARTPFSVPGAQGAPGAPALGAGEAVDRIAGWLLDASGLPRDA